MKNWIKYNKNNCIICNNIYEHDSRQKNSKYCSKRCTSLSFNQKRITGIEGIDYVVCKICNLKFKEINNDHLKTHNITCEEYDKIYNSSRTSENTRKKKDTLTSLMNEEFSKKLSNSHKLENYISKYGDVEGTDRFNLMLQRKRYKNSKQSYIDKYGDDWESIYNNVQKNKKISVDKLILKYGEIEGKERYDKYIKDQKNKNTLLRYIEKNGYDLGIEKWISKNNKISISNSKIDISSREEFKKYIIDVDRFTRISLNMNNIEGLELRGKENGYDLDHIVSKIYGFINNIPPYIISHISNLRIIESSYNRKKSHRSDLPICDIIEKFELDDEYKEIINKILNIKNGKNRY